MRYHHFQPAPLLLPYIECLWMIEASAASAVDHRARMPADSRATLLLSFAGATRLIAGEQIVSEFSLGAHLLGVHSQGYILEHDGDTQLLAVQFRPGGLASFVQYGAGELAERTTPLDLLWGGAASRLCEQIHEAKTPTEKVALYQDTLLQRFAEVSHQPRVLHALARIEAAQGSLSVERLAGEVSLSQKQFERLFERTVGMMPKRYMRLARFQRLVRWLNRQSGVVNWATLAAQFGYYDHSHLAKDFRAFVGTTPSQFAAATAGIVEVAYGHEDGAREV